ncbi:MAG: hypothetical protein ABSE69_02135 [Roseiarcus sp.]|jgi:hypothetical protein
MHSLAAALDSFNRKERNLLVRAILAEGRTPPICKFFCDQVGEKLGFPIPEDAWWATDYHISWLAGALARFIKGDETPPWPNKPEKQDKRRLVEGNQEDVDLVVATGCELVLIEAKAFGAWSNRQLKHKLARLELLHDFYSKIVGTEPSKHAVNFHFLLTSPNRPRKLDPKIIASWPSWACKGRDAPWIELKLEQPKSVFEVTRCDLKGNKSAVGDFWQIERIGQGGEPAASAGTVSLSSPQR